MDKIISIDAEVDGLYGKSFAIAARVYEGEILVNQFLGRCPDSFVTDQWVMSNVLPTLTSVPITHGNPVELEEAFWDFWMSNKQDAIVIAHCGSPVESGLFRRCVERDINSRAFEGPYPCIHDVGTALMLAGEPADSVDGYCKKYSIPVPEGMSPHNPLYDCEVAYRVWIALLSN